MFILEKEAEPARYLIGRLEHYGLELPEPCKTIRVVPVVIFPSCDARIPKTLELGNKRRAYLKFNYLACVLANTQAERYTQSDNIAARLNPPDLQWSREHKIEIHAQAIRGLLHLEPNTGKRLEYLGFIDIYTQALRGRAVYNAPLSEERCSSQAMAREARNMQASHAGIKPRAIGTCICNDAHPPALRRAQRWTGAFACLSLNASAGGLPYQCCNKTGVLHERP